MSARSWLMVAAGVGALGLLALRWRAEPAGQVGGLEVGEGLPGAASSVDELQEVALPQAKRFEAGAVGEEELGAEPLEPGFGVYTKLANTLKIKLVGPEDEPIGARIEVVPRIRGSRAEPVMKFVTPGQWTDFEFPDPIPVLIHISEYPPIFLPPLEALDEGAERGGFTLDKRLLPGANSIVVRLCAGASIEGVVIGETGEGVEGLRVEVHLYGPGVDQVLTATTDANGEYMLPCQSGLHRVRLELGRTSPYPWLGTPFPVDLRLEPGQVARADFTIDSPGGSIAGRVVDAAGQPYGGLQVAALHWPDQGGIPQGDRIPYTVEDEARSTRTGPDGTFELAGLPKGRFGLLYGFNMQRRFGAAIEGLAPFTEHDVRAGERLDVGTITADRLQPAVLKGTVELRGAWQDRAADVEQLELRAWTEPARTDPLDRMLGNAPSGELVPLTLEDGKIVFEWNGGLSHLPVYLELSDAGGERTMLTVQPNKAGDTNVILTFPPERD